MPRGANIPYRLDSVPIGHGGYATVWRGVHRETGVVSAVKRPRSHDAEALARFKREIEVQVALDHPNVMPIWEHSVQERWLAMPLAAHSMTQLVEREGPIDGYQLAQIIRQIANGLDHAHTKGGYVHRDVNPNNTLQLRDEDGSHWVVADWGLVYQEPKAGAPRLTRRGVPIGTEGFTAPEAEKDPLCNNATLDVFSLGRVAHFALTGVWPRKSFPMPSPGWLWKDFVGSCTADAGSRPASIRAALRRLRDIDSQATRMENEAEGLVCPRCEAPVTGARCERCGRVWD